MSKRNLPQLLLVSLTILLASILILETPRLSYKTTSASSNGLQYQEILRIGRGTIEAIAWHPNGNLIALGGGLGVWIYTTEFEEVTLLEGHTRTVTSVAWSQDGKLLASGSKDGTIRIWDTMNWRLMKVLEDELDSIISSIIWNPNIPLLAAMRRVTGSNIVHIWDVETGQILYTLQPQAPLLGAIPMTWSPNGNRIAIGGSDSKIVIWDITTGQFIASFEGHTDSVEVLAWSPDGSRIAGASKPYSRDKALRIWDVSTEENTLVFDSDGLTSIIWSSDSSRIIGVSLHNTVRAWDLSTGQSSALFEMSGGLSEPFAWSRDGNFLARSSRQAADVWDMRTGQLISTLEGHSPEVSLVAWCPCNDKLATVNLDEPAIRLWNPQNGELLHILEPPSSQTVSNLAWSPDGRFLASLSTEALSLIDIWDFSSDQSLLTPLTIHYEGIATSIAWSTDNQHLANVSGYDRDRTVLIWNALNGNLVSRIPENTSLVLSLESNPAANQLAVMREDGTIQIWDMTTLSISATLSAERNYPQPLAILAWSPNGQHLAGASGGRVNEPSFAWTWNVNTNVLSDLFQGYHQGWINSLDWNTDSILLGSSGEDDSTIHIWDSISGQLLLEINRFGDWVTSVSWSPISNKLATGSLDGTIRIWEIQ